jgi:hypothetical protein
MRSVKLLLTSVLLLFAGTGQVRGDFMIYDTITTTDNLTVADLNSNGWSTLYDELYSDYTSNADLQIWLNSGFEYLMLGGTLGATGQIQLAGVIRAEDLAQFTTGNQANTFSETSNYWYNRESYSIGFAPDSIVDLNQADMVDGPGRLSWHMAGDVGGARLGDLEGLNASAVHTKFVLGGRPLPIPSVPEPASLAVLGIMGLAGCSRRRRRSRQTA